MTIPDFADGPPEGAGSQKRDPSEFIPWQRVCEMNTPRGLRPGKLMIVRPLEMVKDHRDGAPDWRMLTIADIAVLEPIEPGSDEYGMPLPGFPAGHQFRNQLVFPGMLNKAWRDFIGATLIGVVYLGTNDKGKPPFLWRSLAKVQQAADLGRRFMLARPEFLIPAPRDPQVAAAAAADPWAAPASHGQVAGGDPWSQVASAPAQYPTGGYQQPTQGYAAPVSPAPQGHPYQTPDPWAQAPTQPVSPAPQVAPAPVQQHPNAGMSTIDQLKQAAAMNAQGQPQSQEPPF